MKKKLLFVFIVIIALLVYGLYWAFFSMSIIRLPKGELISEVQSPKGTYILKAYLTNGGATTSYAIRGELNFKDSRKSAKNIYWNYREDKATIEWVDDDTLIINGIKLEVPNERFDWRRE